MQIEIKLSNPDTGLDWTLPFTSELPAVELKQAFEEMFETNKSPQGSEKEGE